MPSKEFLKEQREHPTFTPAQIKQIVMDHRRLKEKHHSDNIPFKTHLEFDGELKSYAKRF